MSWTGLNFDHHRAPPGAQVGDVLGGKYRIDSILGAGGMGLVLGAYHVQLRQAVALKFLHASLTSDPVTLARFDREARALGQIRSEHVARIMDVEALDDGTPYLVLEYLTGENLEQQLNHRGALEPGEAVDHILEACEAMAEAHGAGIIHRDLKPANLFLAERGDGTRSVKVIDFGISKVTSGSGAFLALNDSGVTRTMNLVGSPLYMSPEQLRTPRDVDARTDVWSLGVTLYELLSCQLPFLDGSVPEVCAAVLKDPIVPLSVRKPGLPLELVAAVERALRKDVADRWPDVASFAQALAPFAASFPADRVARMGRTRRTPIRIASIPELVEPRAPTSAFELVAPPRTPRTVEACSTEPATPGPTPPVSVGSGDLPFLVPSLEGSSISSWRHSRLRKASFAVAIVVMGFAALGASAAPPNKAPQVAARSGAVVVRRLARAIAMTPAAAVELGAVASPSAGEASAPAGDDVPRCEAPAARERPAHTPTATRAPIQSSRDLQARYFEHRR